MSILKETIAAVERVVKQSELDEEVDMLAVYGNLFCRELLRQSDVPLDTPETRFIFDGVTSLFSETTDSANRLIHVGKHLVAKPTDISDLDQSIYKF